MITCMVAARKDPTRPLHLQSFVTEAMWEFLSKQKAWQQRQCNVCKEALPRYCLTSKSYVCHRCKRHKRSPKLFSAENDMDPGPVPLCLEGLTQVGQLLIAQGCPVVCVYRKKVCNMGTKITLNFPQDSQGFLNSLPSYVIDLPLLSG